MVNNFTMSLTETKPTSRSLKLDKQKQEQKRREANQREIARNNPGTSLTWIIGTDAFATVETWKDFDNLISLVEFLVIVRPGNKVDESKVNMKIKWSSIEIGALNISSTQVRAAIQQGQDFSLLVPASVAEYIKEKGLYGAA